MDAVEYLRAFYRMCDSNKYCSSCEAIGVCQHDCEKAEQMVEIVEEWAKEHPAKTRQSELLKLIPNAKMMDGAINVYPCLIDPLYDERHMGECGGRDCDQCRREYWTEEIE